MKKNKKPFSLVRAWPYLEEDLTEAEGRVLEAMRNARLAETNPVFCGEEEATESLRFALYQIKHGALPTLGKDYALTPKEVKALGRVYKLWRKWAKRNTRNAREQVKQQAKQQAKPLQGETEALRREGVTA